MLARIQLLPTAREAETGESDAEKRERGGFRHGAPKLTEADVRDADVVAVGGVTDQDVGRVPFDPQFLRHYA